jgi:alkylresorcinol/alkylpyrone synthase
MTTSPVALLSLATASPPHELRQDEVAARAQALFEDRFPALVKLLPVFRNAGIIRRQAVMPVEWYLQPRGWPDRTEAYLSGAVELFSAAAERALGEAGLTGPEVDVIVTVSSTGIATPSLEARAMDRLGFRPDAVRVPVFGLGCAGGAAGFALASRLARCQAGATVLLVVVELCTLSFRLDDMSGADVVATALFGDGAAACVLRAGGEGIAEVAGVAEHTWPGTLDIMGWRVDPQGLGVIFAQAIPPFVRNRLRPAMDAMLAGQGLACGDVDRFVCHPGGAKVVEALEGALDLGQGALDLERAVLAEHGNMSAPTVLFVLDAARRRGLPARAVLTALGPGFTASAVTLEAACPSRS